MSLAAGKGGFMVKILGPISWWKIRLFRILQLLWSDTGSMKLGCFLALPFPPRLWTLGCGVVFFPLLIAYGICSFQVTSFARVNLTLSSASSFRNIR